MQYIIGIFDYSQDFEEFLNNLQLQPYRCTASILKVVPGINEAKKRGLFADGKSLSDGLATGSAIGGLFGSIYGSGLLDFPLLNPLFKLGPITNSLIGFILGGLMGFTLDWFFSEKTSTPKYHLQTLNEYAVLITFNGSQLLEEIKALLLTNNARKIVHSLK